MRHLLLCIFALLLCLPVPVEAYDLLIIKSQPSPLYDEVLRGIYSVRKFTERVITLSDYAEVDIKRIVKEDRPLAVVTLGDFALESTRKVNQVPIVSLMAISYRGNTNNNNKDNQHGIEVLIPPERYLALFRQLKTHRVGVLYSKEKTGTYLQRAQRLASKFGVVIVPREVMSSKDVMAQLDSLKGNVDALWMFPDSMVVSQVTMEGFTNFSIQQKVPLVSYAGTYLSHGASVVIELDRTDLGVQAGEMIVSLQEDQSAPVDATPRKTLIRFNQTIIRRLGISPDLIGKIQQNWE